MRLYAIGDIHGQLDMLRAAHDRIAADREACGDAGAPVVHLGDLCDRGPDTAGVIQFLVDGIDDGQPWIVLKGNHDQMFAGFLEDYPDGDDGLWPEEIWLHSALGGGATLRSYGINTARGRPSADLHREAADLVPDAHRRLLGQLRLYFETGDLIFVHAGIRPGVPMANQDEDDLVWIRDGFLDDMTDHGKIVVHGHTPVEEPMHCGNRIALDTGAGFYHPLTAAVFEGRDCWILTEGGRQALRPPG